MARYVDVDALKILLHDEDFGTPDERWRPESEFAKMIDATPTADVVEVVRCKYCMFVRLMKDEKTLVCMRQTSYKRPEDYCSYGKLYGKE